MASLVKPLQHSGLGERIKAYSRRLFAEPDNPFDSAGSIETRIHEKKKRYEKRY